MDLTSQPRTSNSKPLVFPQHNGEPVRAYMWRVESLLLDLGFDMDDCALVRVILRGLLPAILAVIPDTINPVDRQNLLLFADNLHLYLPKDHSYWTSTSGPDAVVPSNSTLQPPAIIPALVQPTTGPCYKCGEANHYAYYCINKRNRKLKRKRKVSN